MDSREKRSKFKAALDFLKKILGRNPLRPATLTRT